ncbi:MAG: DUF2306 domain-containing protein [Sphingomonadales bacterium]|nr:DUF2306 domain-containing protein [Sphingomonadales bacterium]MBD3773558.1 DUF2306 domain-containing protein [Paracoccaceae bacterium]
MSQAAARHANPFELSRPTRALVALACVGMSGALALALARMATGVTPDLPAARTLAVTLHIATVVPAVPLGGWLLLARKGTARHKLLGKVWVALMVVTALSAIFIRQLHHGELSWIHIFVPLTLFGAWRAVATARSGNIAAHKRQIVGMYLGALLIPGLFTFVPGRMMWVWLLG